MEAMVLLVILVQIGDDEASSVGCIGRILLGMTLGD